MSQAAGAYIYQGPWINWSHGLIQGSTVTLSTRNGAILIAFLALLVKFAGSQLWGIVKYSIHQHRASQSSRDGLYHQTQAILRNADSANQATQELLQATFYWRKYAKNPFRRSMALAMLPLINLIAFGIAGIFSSEVSKATGDEVLIRSNNCGVFQYGDGAASDLVYRTKSLNDTITSAAYARQCYGSDSSSLLQCNQFAQPRIKFTTNRNATCPFSPGLCRHGLAYQMDTGPVDSHTVLGINARPEDRIIFRKVTTCAPLSMTNYSEAVNGTKENGLLLGDTFIDLLYGPIDFAADSSNNDSVSNNFTYRYNTHTAKDEVGYTLGLSSQWGGGYSNGNTSGWIPIPELNQTDSDISILFLSANSIIYNTNVTDPWFSANFPYFLGNETFLQADDWVNALGCIDQSQFCNPNTGACTPLESSTANGKSIFNIGLNAAQGATIGRHLSALPSMTITGVVQGRSAASLRAQESVFQLQSAALPDDQWTIELDSWFATGLATLQNLVVQFAAGPPELDVDGPGQVNKVNATDRLGMFACRNQKVRGQSLFQSFSVVGVAFIVVVAGLLSILNLVLPYTMTLVRKVFTKGKWKGEQWRLYDKLQLLRMVFEARGDGTWKGEDDAVPVTRMGEKFVLFDKRKDGGHATPREEVVEHGAPEEYGLMNPEWKPVVRASVDEISYRR